MNGLNEWKDEFCVKNKIQVYAVYHFKFKDTNKWKVKGWKKRNHKWKPQESCNNYVNIKQNRL